MPEIKETISLKPYNTFGLEAKAKYFAIFESVEDLKDILQDQRFKKEKKLLLGGGSNILLMNDFDGLVLKNEIKGIEITSENSEKAILKAGGGENWHSFVLDTIERNLSGIENLSLIPGTVGAAPMQNIGAYGVEIKDVFVELEALNLETFEIERFDKAKCNFGYRESYFKHEGKGKYVILNVSFELSKIPNFNVSYGAIQDTLNEMGVKELSTKAISDAVIAIRKSKLPDPAEIGNSGSFFKNPEIEKSLYDEVKQQYPSIPSYPIDENTVKVPAGWLIEQAGWKGKRIGDIGVHAKQALVLVNYGGGKGQEIANLAYDIQASVLEKFGITINPEVNFIS
ncbi:UDP-N-acetylmuramate dehydrogenase [Lacihabitans soyangensis]|uniref:UDP-N-acetylenolpyruvoylglucosamine reductase n=1 Tax=Lacihabitans soyangensis TaxID=869394 RepID=A0AAE3H0N8_9BACT|nr:UDP-N-acetylmuramate dehydrogenase [Lacihabitans soyangensis]MCP9762782.1 UDP-N-acetylmuramate dehydrogenase [Lacihabitans soyangensis]